jgi:TolB-like protein
MGTVSYMSPEQSAGKLVDNRSDIWSIGVVLYEMIAGVVPFQGKDIHRQIIAIQETDPIPLTQLIEGVPERLEEIVSKCLAKEKDERYQTAKDLLIDLRNLRRKLDVDAEIERTVAPESRTTSGTAAGANSQAASTREVQNSASSLEYAVTQAMSHKLAAAIIGLLLVGVISAVGYWALYSRGNSSRQINSIAVLPFENRSGNSDTDYLSDGLSESLIYRLSQLPGLKVSPTNSVLRYKGAQLDLAAIARELEVDAVMSGRLSQRGDDLTISVELTDGRTKKLIWAEQYARKMSDLLATQREIAAAVTQKLQLKLSGDETRGLTKRYTDDNEAYQLYLKGRFYWNKRSSEGLKKAIEQFKAASERDPNFALAYVGLADSYLVGLYSTRGSEKEPISLAKAYATRALDIDPSLAEAHASLGLANTYLWNWAEAEKYLKRAIELNPKYPSARHWYSRLLRALGRYDEGLEQIREAKKADELSAVISNNLAESLFEIGNIPEAMEESKRSIEVTPLWVSYRTLAHCYLRLDQKEEALANARKTVELLDGSPVALKVLGHVQAAIGNRSEALAIVRDLEDKFAKGEADGRDVAVVYAGLGENDKVFEWLEKDFQSRNSSLMELQMEVPFMPLHSDPRFKDLLRRMGLPE